METAERISKKSTPRQAGALLFSQPTISPNSSKPPVYTGNGGTSKLKPFYF